MDTFLLGGLTHQQFLQQFWQKKPLLIRQAMPGFKGLLSHEALVALACNPEVESRLIRHKRKGWELRHGPQKHKYLTKSKHPWTVLVQGLNLWHNGADALLRHFDFIPRARLDDLMVSYAVDGGGVGPHFDHYDVFLLQGTGKRRWQISQQYDRRFYPDLPLKILQHFEPEEEWVLEPGDMLYLPPHCAHNGIAEGDNCTTYSIGFRSPSSREIGQEFLMWLYDRISSDTQTKNQYYADPDLHYQQNPAYISREMLAKIKTMIEGLQWSDNDIAQFTGQYLSTPKNSDLFDCGAEIGRDAFARALQHNGIALDRGTSMLYNDCGIYLNGEILTPADQIWRQDDITMLQRLADQRQLEINSALSDALCDALYEAYLDGYLHLQ